MKIPSPTSQDETAAQATTRRHLRPSRSVGKIARMPAQVRCELNRRMFDGEPYQRILSWLNAEPTATACLQSYRCGPKKSAASVTPQNLSKWRQTGYQEYIRQRNIAEVLRLAGAVQPGTFPH